MKKIIFGALFALLANMPLAYANETLIEKILQCKSDQVIEFIKNCNEDPDFSQKSESVLLRKFLALSRHSLDKGYQEVFIPYITGKALATPVNISDAFIENSFTELQDTLKTMKESSKINTIFDAIQTMKKRITHTPVTPVEELAQCSYGQSIPDIRTKIKESLQSEIKILKICISLLPKNPDSGTLQTLKNIEDQWNTLSAEQLIDQLGSIENGFSEVFILSPCKELNQNDTNVCKEVSDLCDPLKSDTEKASNCIQKIFSTLRTQLDILRKIESKEKISPNLDFLEILNIEFNRGLIPKNIKPLLQKMLQGEEDNPAAYILYRGASQENITYMDLFKQVVQQMNPDLNGFRVTLPNAKTSMNQFYERIFEEEERSDHYQGETSPKEGFGAFGLSTSLMGFDMRPYESALDFALCYSGNLYQPDYLIDILLRDFFPDKIYGASKKNAYQILFDCCDLIEQPLRKTMKEITHLWEKMEKSSAKMPPAGLMQIFLGSAVDQVSYLCRPRGRKNPLTFKSSEKSEESTNPSTIIKATRTDLTQKIDLGRWNLQARLYLGDEVLYLPENASYQVHYRQEPSPEVVKAHQLNVEALGRKIAELYALKYQQGTQEHKFTLLETNLRTKGPSLFRDLYQNYTQYFCEQGRLPDETMNDLLKKHHLPHKNLKDSVNQNQDLQPPFASANSDSISNLEIPSVISNAQMQNAAHRIGFWDKLQSACCCKRRLPKKALNE